MINCTCIVQAGQMPDQNKEKLQSVLSSFSSESFAEGAQIAWIPVPAGSGFTEGKPSSSSIVSINCKQNLKCRREGSAFTRTRWTLDAQHRLQHGRNCCGDRRSSLELSTGDADAPLYL